MQPNFTDRLRVNLERAMSKHAWKNYGLPTLLILDGSMNPVTISKYGPSLAEELFIPIGCGYQAVYLALTVNRSNAASRREHLRRAKAAYEKIGQTEADAA